MATATIVLQSSLSHTVRLSGLGEVKFVKGQPHTTSDDAMIRYAKDRPAIFGLTVTKADPPKPQRLEVKVETEVEDEAEQVHTAIPRRPVVPKRTPFRSKGSDDA